MKIMSVCMKCYSLFCAPNCNMSQTYYHNCHHRFGILSSVEPQLDKSTASSLSLRHSLIVSVATSCVRDQVFSLQCKVLFFTSQMTVRQMFSSPPSSPRLRNMDEVTAQDQANGRPSNTICSSDIYQVPVSRRPYCRHRGSSSGQNRHKDLSAPRTRNELSKMCTVLEGDRQSCS